jgi:hypothetical protein
MVSAMAQVHVGIGRSPVPFRLRAVVHDATELFFSASFYTRRGAVPIEMQRRWLSTRG